MSDDVWTIMIPSDGPVRRVDNDPSTDDPEKVVGGADPALGPVPVGAGYTEEMPPQVLRQ